MKKINIESLRESVLSVKRSSIILLSEVVAKEILVGLDWFLDRYRWAKLAISHTGGDCVYSTQLSDGSYFRIVGDCPDGAEMEIGFMDDCMEAARQAETIFNLICDIVDDSMIGAEVTVLFDNKGITTEVK